MGDAMFSEPLFKSGHAMWISLPTGVDICSLYTLLIGECRNLESALSLRSKAIVLSIQIHHIPFYSLLNYRFVCFKAVPYVFQAHTTLIFRREKYNPVSYPMPRMPLESHKIECWEIIVMNPIRLFLSHS
jgi:hypothetical protein